jgi:hypothetical protein
VLDIRLPILATWLALTRDGQVHENLSQVEAAQAIRRAMHGLDPFEDEARSRSTQQSHAADARVAA